MTETRTVHDPFLGKDVEVSHNLVDRLRGRYACGPMLPNGQPEFGWREFETSPVCHEAAAEIDRLREQLIQKEKALATAHLAVLNWGIQASDAVKVVRPFARLAEVCDHFKRMPDQEICSWRIGGRRQTGPTADDCRKARDWINKVNGDGI